MTFVFAVAPDHPLASAEEPLSEDDICRFPAAVAADSSRALPAGHAGIFHQQRTLTGATIDHKIAMQKAGLGVGWLPRARVQALLASGQLIEKRVDEPRQPIALQAARHADDKGKALMWFWHRLIKDATITDWLDS